MSNWYIIHIDGKRVTKIKERLMETANKIGLNIQPDDILVPTQIVKGKKKQNVVKSLFGYAAIKDINDPRIFDLAKKTQGVHKFISNHPYPEKDLNSFIEIAQKEPEEITISFMIGDEVVIIDGAFDGFSGTVVQADNEKKKAKVEINIFGSPTPTTINYSELEKK